jgi:membrane-associated phospholipid phosphatase
MTRFLLALDHRLFFLINEDLGGRCDWLDSFFAELSSLGAWPIVLVALALLSAAGARSLRRHVFVLAACILAFIPARNLLKQWADRPRPAAVFQDGIEKGTVRLRLVEQWRPRGGSFPSGHSMLAFFVMTYAGLNRRGCRLFALTLATLVALSRVYVGAHFPSDCIAGALLGALGGWIAWQGFRLLDQALDRAGTRKAAASGAGPTRDSAGGGNAP